MVVAAEFAIAGIRPLLPKPEAVFVYEDKRSAAAGNETYDVLFFGDSTALHGMSPKIFDERTGLTSYNFATYASASGFSSVWLLREYLATHATRPRLLVFILNVQYLHVTPNIPPFDRYFDTPDLREDLAQTDPAYWRDPRRLLEKILPSYRNRELIATSVSMLARGEPTKEYDRGYIPNHLEMDGPNAKLKKFMDFVHNDGMRFHEEQAVFLQKFCQIATELSIPVYVKISPLSERVMSDPDAVEFARGAVLDVEDVLTEWPNCMIDPRIEMYADEAMENMTHTNSTGAIVLTNGIIDELQKLDQKEEGE